MNKQFPISVVVLFVVSMLLGFVVHGLLLEGEYAKLVPSLIYFAVQPLPSDLVAQQIVYDTISMAILGIVTAAMNRGSASAPRPA